MLTKEFTIQNPTGLHARPASEFTRCAAKFHSKITIARNGSTPVNAKSMIMVLSQGLGQGTDVTLTADGDDEAEALEALTQLLESLKE